MAKKTKEPTPEEEAAARLEEFTLRLTFLSASRGLARESFGTTVDTEIVFAVFRLVAEAGRADVARAWIDQAKGLLAEFALPHTSPEDVVAVAEVLLDDPHGRDNLVAACTAAHAIYDDPVTTEEVLYVYREVDPFGGPSGGDEEDD